MFIREPSAVFWTFGFPIVLSLALGIAFRNKPPDPIRVAIEQADGAEAVRDALTGMKVVVLDAARARQELRTGKVAVVVVLEGQGRVYLYDETRPESRVARLAVDDRLQRAAGRVDAVPTSDRKITEPGARYVDFLLPGIIGMNVMSSGMWGIGYVIVEMRTKKLIKRMIATPMRRGEFLLSFVVMRISVLIFEIPVLLLFAYFAFGVHVRGPVTVLVGLVVLGAVAFAGLGLLVSSRAENTQTVGGLMNLVMLPMFMCSGVFFSSHNFPDAMQPVIRLLPLTALNDALRSVMNEGAGLVEVSSKVALLALWTLSSFVVALRVFRWR
jgi:ABC-type multidrug transport system permease subunit